MRDFLSEFFAMTAMILVLTGFLMLFAPDVINPHLVNTLMLLQFLAAVIFWYVAALLRTERSDK